MVRTNVLLAICYTVLVLVVYVVVIGGIICIRDDDYDFAEYLTDLQGIYKLLVTGVVSGIAHEYFSGNGRLNNGVSRRSRGIKEE